MAAHNQHINCRAYKTATILVSVTSRSRRVEAGTGINKQTKQQTTNNKKHLLYDIVSYHHETTISPYAACFKRLVWRILSSRRSCARSLAQSTFHIKENHDGRRCDEMGLAHATGTPAGLDSQPFWRVIYHSARVAMQKASTARHDAHSIQHVVHGLDFCHDERLFLLDNTARSARALSYAFHWDVDHVSSVWVLGSWCHSVVSFIQWQLVALLLLDDPTRMDRLAHSQVQDVYRAAIACHSIAPWMGHCHCRTAIEFVQSHLCGLRYV